MEEKVEISGTYNTRPNGFQEIEEQDYYQHYYMMYSVHHEQHRSIFYDEEHKNPIMKGMMSARLYLVRNHFSFTEIGFGVMWDWKNKKPIYFIFEGFPDSWLDFKQKFAAQFAGDNS